MLVNTSLLLSVIARMLVAGTPLLLGTVGEIYSERSGILNLGVEGMMAVGAVTGFGVAQISGNMWLGILTAGLAGLALSLLHAFVSITLKASQVISGLALTMLGLGISGFMGKRFVGVPLPFRFQDYPIPLLSRIPFIGSILFTRDAVFYLSIVLTLALWFLLYHTRWGVQIRSVGENPKASDAMGIPVYRIQYICVMVGGFLAGIAGSYISLIYSPTWVEGISGGRGWIVVALTILAVWNPIKAFIGAYLFGLIYVLQYLLQSKNIPINILMMLPYVTTLFVLLLGSNNATRKKSGAPRFLGTPFNKGER
jgi:simple sugar transport system permease protein